MMRRNQGFTLIEIMLVMVIIGCALGIVVLSLPGMNGQGTADLKTQSEKLTATLAMASEQAMLEGRALGLRVTPQGYQFMVREAKNAAVASAAQSTAIPTAWDDQVWVPFKKDKFAAAGRFPDGTSMDLKLGGLSLDPEESQLGLQKQDWIAERQSQQSEEPQITILPGGEVTPFELTLSQAASDTKAKDQKTGPFARITGDEDGQIRLLSRADVDAEAKK